MLKAVLLATSMFVAAPVFAQDAPKPAESQPAQDVPAATTETPVTDDAADPAAETTTAATATPQDATAPAAQPAEVAAQPAPTTSPAPAEGVAAAPAPTTAASPAPVEAAAAQPAPAQQPASSQEQVAQAVGRDFGTYDADGDGALNATEFASWMGALRKAAEPTFAPDSPEAKTWSAQAFTSADADKSASVNKQELTKFLTPKGS